METMVEERVIRDKNGKWKEFNRRGVLIAEGNYINDLKHGVWREYYENGHLLIEECYEHGIPHGLYASYHPNGQLFSIGQYQKGKREGNFTVYDEDGRLIKTMLFIQDVHIEEMANEPAHESSGKARS
jgi:antitoxin component YwqK of YwqJK toxin-antitoxin module